MSAQALLLIILASIGVAVCSGCGIAVGETAFRWTSTGWQEAYTEGRRVELGLSHKAHVQEASTVDLGE